MRKCIFFKIYPANMSSLKASRNDIKDIAEKLRWPSQLLNPLLLCHSELLANTVNYSLSPSATSISISLTQTLNELVFEYSDNCKAYNPFAQPVAEIDELPLLAEHGRGLSLIQASCQTLRYQERTRPYVNSVECRFAWPVQTQKQHVLLVEDDPVQNMLYREYLSNDFFVHCAHTGKEALGVLEHENIDLVISDISMPDTNGVELRKKLLSQSNTDLIPFMFLTGTEDVTASQELAYLGIDDFLQKPVNKAQLVSSAKRVLGRIEQLVNRLGEQLDNHITQALCPRLPEHLPGWEIASDQRDTGQGGGDAVFVEATPNPTLVLLDVMGHDISAKFFAHAHTAYLRGLVRSMTPMESTQPPFDPAKLLNQFSDAAYADDLLSHTILTTLIVELLPNGRVHYASAGHPPPIVVGSSGLRELQGGGSLPGLLANCQYRFNDAQLQPGERIVMYSDGLFESAATMKERQQLENDMKRILQQSAELPIKDATAYVMGKFDELAGSARDDVSLVMLGPLEVKGAV